GDVRGARAANAVPVGVTTGPCDAEELRAAGADVVLTSLMELPAWLEAHAQRTAS
ncbi:HAD family hydrolase, partial [Streptomyces sp. DT225]